MEYGSLTAENQAVKREKAVEKQSLESAIDTAERKKAEEESRMKNMAMESAINAIALADLKGNVTYVNRCFLKMWGYQDKEEVLGKLDVEFWDSGEAATGVMEALRNGAIGPAS